MTLWRVMYSVDVEADSQDDAIAKADEGKGGGHWEAVPDSTEEISIPDSMYARDLLIGFTDSFRLAEDELDRQRDALYRAIRTAHAHGLSQSEIHRITGLNRITVRRVVTGER